MMALSVFPRTFPGTGTSPPLRRHAAVIALVVGAAGAIPPTVAQHAVDPEVWIEMRKMVRHAGPLPSIEEDVAALAGPDVRRVGPRLIDRGPEVLPVVHAALLAPDVEPRHALRLLQVIGPLSQESSVPVLLELLDSPSNPARRDALLILARLPATDEAAAFVVKLAADEDEPWRTRRMAHSWFGLQRDSRGRRFAEALLSDADPERRAVGLFVLARLGDDSALEPISEMLAAGAPSNMRDMLLLALAELVTPDGFELRVPAGLAWSDGFKDALRYTQYRAAQAADRPQICKEMLRAQTPGHRTIAVRCLLESGHAADLRPFAALDLESPGGAALLRNEIRRAGWRVVDTETEFRIEPGPGRSSR